MFSNGIGDFGGSRFYGYETDLWDDENDIVNLFFLQNIIPLFLELPEFTRDSTIIPTSIIELAKYNDILIEDSSVTYNNENKVYRVEYSAKTDSDELVNNLIAYVVTPNEQAVLITFINFSEFGDEEIDLILGSIRVSED